MSSTEPMPDYENPPVVEVVFGVRFNPPGNFQAPHIGLLWDYFDRKEYPKFDERAPITYFSEMFGNSSQSSGPEIQFSNEPPLPRVLFINKNQNQLIQVQSDGFFQNWRKTEETESYPRYEHLFPKFMLSWEQLQKFFENEGINQPELKQYELTYINHILKGQGWDSLSDIGKVFSVCRVPDQKFLEKPETLTWRKVFRFPENTGSLHIRSNKVVDKKTSNELLVLNMSAKGYIEGDIKRWFDMAHEWIVRGFADITDETIQKNIWGRKQ